MKLAWKELIYSKKKYLLIEIIMVLMIFMVLFLSGLANGLGRAVSASIENVNAKYFLISDTVENLITVSELENSVYEEVQSMTKDQVASLDIQRMYISIAEQEEKIDITYFAIEEGSFLQPKLIEGKELSADENGIILDETFELEGIAIGDVIRDAATGIELTVVGFTSDQMYGHTPVGFITTKTYTKIRSSINPGYEPSYHAIAIEGDDIKGISIEGAETVDKKTIVESIPGYSAEQITINMILWVLVVITAAILGVFFYILTIQKEKQFGVLKAIGMQMNELLAMIISQVSILAVCGGIIANILAFATAAILPQSMPFYLQITAAVMATVVFVIISILCSILSVVKVAKVDPIKSIGGAE